MQEDDDYHRRPLTHDQFHAVLDSLPGSRSVAEIGTIVYGMDDTRYIYDLLEKNPGYNAMDLDDVDWIAISTSEWLPSWLESWRDVKEYRSEGMSLVIYVGHHS